TYQALLTTFTDFLLVAFHTILYERKLYPQTTFLLTRAYNFPVRQNRHPLVCKWILDAVTAIQTQLLKGVVKRVIFVIYSQQNEVLERFLFDTSGFPMVPEKERFTEFASVETDAEEIGNELQISKIDIEEQLRATIRKLAYCGSKLGDLPDGCTYTVAVELKDEAEPPIGDPQPWIPSQPSLQTGEKGKSETVGKDLRGTKTVPVRAVESGEFVFESWIEE
ncbi:DNA-binding protein, partial [Bisporella sp. PMI_857]